MTDTSYSIDPTPGPAPSQGVPVVRATTPMDMLDRAISANMAPELIKQLMDLQERYERNEAKRQFDTAIADAKAELPVIVKRNKVDFTSKRTGDQTNYSYEDMATIAQVIDPILSRHGLSYRFRTDAIPKEKTVIVTCVLGHRAGYSEENSLPGPYDESGSKNALQALGSTVTYLQRYTLKAALGIAAARDDDARSLSTEDDSGGAPIKKMNLDQVAALESLIINTGANRDKFLKVAGVKELGEIPAWRYEQLTEALRIAQQRRLAMAAQASPEGEAQRQEAVPS